MSLKNITDMSMIFICIEKYCFEEMSLKKL